MNISTQHGQTSQLVYPLHVGAPIGCAVGRETSFPIEVYALGVGVTVARDGEYVALGKRRFELEALGARFIFDPLQAHVANGFVAPVQGDVAAVFEPLQAVDEVGGQEVLHGDLSPAKTAILSLPQGLGKTTMAVDLACALGCKGVVDDWCPGLPMRIGALHLTSCDVLSKCHG